MYQEVQAGKEVLGQDYWGGKGVLMLALGGGVLMMGKIRKWKRGI